MTPAIRRGRLGLALLLAGACCSAGPALAQDQRAQVWVPYAHKGELWRVRADGQGAERLSSRSPSGAAHPGLFDAWFEPDLDPATGRIAALRVLRWAPHRIPADPTTLDQWHELVVLDPEDLEAGEVVLYRTRKRLGGPAFAPGGARLVCIEGRRRLLMVEVAGSSVRALTVDGVRELGAEQEWRRARWSADGAELLLQRVGRRPRETVLGRVPWSAERPAFQPVVRWAGGRAPEGVRTRRDAASLWTHLFGPAPDSSPLRPDFHVTRDGRLGFRLAKKEGLFARGWIEGFEAETGAVFEVRTLWRSLYAE